MRLDYWRRTTGGFQIRRGSFASNPGGLLNAQQRPAEPAQRDDLLLLFFGQDIHRRRVTSVTSMSWISYPVGRFSGVHGWPVLGVPRGSMEFTIQTEALPRLARV
jgi:hypothetical protein